MNQIKIGFTDLADPFYDRSWIEKLSTVDGAIVISKGLGHSDEQFEDALLENKNKIIFHCTITGLGGTDIEPGVPEYQDTLRKLDDLIKRGFDPQHVVVRIDPIIGSMLFNQLNKTKFQLDPIMGISNDIIGYQNLLETIMLYICKMEISRIRYSFLDLYSHSRKRLENLGYKVPEWPMDFNEIEEWKKFFLKMEKKFHTINFCSCAEKFVLEHHKVGCLSKTDFEILGLDPNECIGKCQQRKTCLCAGNKVELLKYAKECPHRCAYCYVK